MAFRARTRVRPSALRSPIQSSRWDTPRAEPEPQAEYELRLPSHSNVRSVGARCCCCLPPPQSRFPRRKARADDLAGGVIFRIADDLDTPAILRNRVALGNGVSGVVSALGLNVRTNLADDRTHVEFRKDHDCIHV